VAITLCVIKPNCGDAYSSQRVKPREKQFVFRVRKDKARVTQERDGYDA
jgi:hypothetical protein